MRVLVLLLLVVPMVLVGASLTIDWRDDVNGGMGTIVLLQFKHKAFSHSHRCFPSQVHVLHSAQ